MIESLDDAWKWYSSVRTLAHDLKRIAGKLNDPALQAVLGRDKSFRDASASDLVERANTILNDLDDLAVLVLFSVFEAMVRDRAMADVEKELETIRHPAVKWAIKDLKEAIENGSFGNLTESYKEMDKVLTTEVNQVRKFRNWVAHGRRGKVENNVDPASARERLGRYLDRLTEVETAGTMPTLPPEPEPFRLPKLPSA